VIQHYRMFGRELTNVNHYRQCYWWRHCSVFTYCDQYDRNSCPCHQGIDFYLLRMGRTGVMRVQTTINPCKHTYICIILTFSFYFVESTYINIANTNRLKLFRLIIVVLLWETNIRCAKNAVLVNVIVGVT